MTLIGLPWFVLQTGGELVEVGVVTAVGTAGSAVCGMLGGPLVDRIGLRRTAMLSLVVGGTAMGAIVVLHASAALSFPLLVGLTLAATALDGPGTTALTGLIGDLARARGTPLESANSAFQGIGHLIFLVSPALGGLVAATSGSDTLLLVDAAACLLAAVVLLAGVRRRGPARPGPPGVYLNQLREGIAVLRGDPLIRALVPYGTVLDALGTALVTIVLVAYSHQVLGTAAGLGAMVSAFSIGALLGAVGYGMLATRVPRRAAFFAGHLVVIALLALLASGPPVGVLLGAIVVAGVLGAPIEAVSVAVLQERVPPAAFGRVAGARAALTAVAAPAAVGAVSVAVAGAGLNATLVGMAVCYAVLVAGGLLHPGLRRFTVQPGVTNQSSLSHDMTAL
ncbi:hypothetical protein KRM28CT15_08040 [Krasilnikovia sp. M28-CT-15]